VVDVSTQRNVALVVGARGIIGGSLVDHLAERDWDVIGVSRRGGEDSERVRHLPVDLLDRDTSRSRQP
jgi:nucleoside-diphosphate-sugar epimerase